MKLSIVIISWRDRKVIAECLRSIFAETQEISFEVILSDNGSTDGCLGFVRQHYPQVRIVENGANLGFGRGNNAGIPYARGEYVLFLNPDTIVLDRALDRWMEYVEKHPEPGAFGCRILNPDGSFQISARPAPEVWRYLISALYLRGLGRFSRFFRSDTYVGWDGLTEREVGWISGCCIMLPAVLLRDLDGFDDRFFYHFEESDLCVRVHERGFPLLFYPDAEIIHLGGQAVGHFPIRFTLETYRNRYRFFFKHYGERALRRIRLVSLIGLCIRRMGYELKRLVRPSKTLNDRIEMYRVLIKWNWRVNPMHFIESGEEPYLGYESLAPAANMLDENASGQLAPMR